LERDTPRRRGEAEALLDGYPGLARRLDLVSESTRTLLQEDNRRIVALSQAVDRIARDPSSLAAELEELRRRFGEVARLLEGHAARWGGPEPRTPADPPVASSPLAATRRMLATTRDQFLP